MLGGCGDEEREQKDGFAGVVGMRDLSLDEKM